MNYVYKVLEIAMNELGYLEKIDSKDLYDKTKNAGHNNYTKYAKDSFPHLQGYAWCLMFIWWCFEKAYGEKEAIKLLGGNKTAKCSILKDILKNQITNKPDVGDLVFFKNTNNEINHVGLVIAVTNSQITTIEGNTSVGNNCVIPNGGGVYKKEYTLDNKRIDSFVKIKYDTCVGDSCPINFKEVKEEIGIVNATNVNIRVGAGTDYESIGQVSRPFKFKILCKEKDKYGNMWYQFNYNNELVYIISKYVDIIT